MPNNQRSRNYCFTLNNYTDDDLQSLRRRGEELLSRDGPNGLRFMVIGREVGESGTPHLQGYVEFWTQRSFAAVKRFIHQRAHVELRRGTSEQAYVYCTKSGQYSTLGTRSVPVTVARARGGDAERQRWDDARKAAIEGRLDDVPSDIFIRCYGAIRSIHRDNLPSVPDVDETAGN